MKLPVSEHTGRGVPRIAEKQGKDVFRVNENRKIRASEKNTWQDIMGSGIAETEYRFRDVTRRIGQDWRGVS